MIIMIHLIIHYLNSFYMNTFHSLLFYISIGPELADRQPGERRGRRHGPGPGGRRGGAEQRGGARQAEREHHQAGEWRVNCPRTKKSYQWTMWHLADLLIFIFFFPSEASQRDLNSSTRIAILGSQETTTTPDTQMSNQRWEDLVCLVHCPFLHTLGWEETYCQRAR